MLTNRSLHHRPLHTLASRVGHDAVWLAIAGLFCVVEAAVKVSEVVPLIRSRVSRSSASAAVPRAFAR